MCTANVVTERLSPHTIDPLVGAYRTEFAAECMAITIGPRSMLDRCYLVPVDSEPPLYPGVANETTRNEFPPNVIALSVERPWVGHVRGPFLVYGPHAQDTDLDGALTLPWVGGVGGTLFGDTGGFNSYLDLQFYDTIPHFLPTKRAPVEHLHRYAEFGTTGVSSDLLAFPGWGRRQVSITITVDGLSAGDIDFTVSGGNIALLNGTLMAQSVELQASTTISADGSTSFVYTGEFDAYELNIAEGAALNAGVTVDVVFKAWD